MLVKEKIKILNDFVSTLSQEEMIWVNGYLSGLIQHKPATQIAVNKITIAYASETGNSKKLSTQLATTAKKKNIGVKLISLDQYNEKTLINESYFFIVMSTQGEGEPPPTGLKFYDYIHQEKLDLSKLNFAVLGLGDTAYPLFCKAAEDVFYQLQNLGGKAIIPLQKCDLDYETIAIKWFENLLQKINASSQLLVHNSLPLINISVANAKKIFTGKIIKSINLNDNKSSKKTFHIVIKTDETVPYELGDSLSLYPKNDEPLVRNILKLLNINENTSLELRNETSQKTVFHYLSEKFNINYLTKSVIQKYGALNDITIPAETRLDLFDLLRQYPLKKEVKIEQFLEILQKISPRLYTIASSPIVHTDEIHLTVTLDEFEINNEVRYGVCSYYLSTLKEKVKISFGIQKNKHFNLAAPDKDIIMIGTGAGIAPYRAFVAERDNNSATGKNWLFFGDRNFAFDFLYQTEWQQYFATDALHKINLAWSRDNTTPYYIQQEIEKEAITFWEWIENGAIIYVCGDKKKMCVAVENTIINIIKKYKNINEEKAKFLLNKWEDEGRYQKDVY